MSVCFLTIGALGIAVGFLNLPDSGGFILVGGAVLMAAALTCLTLLSVTGRNAS